MSWDENIESSPESFGLSDTYAAEQAGAAVAGLAGADAGGQPKSPFGEIDAPPSEDSDYTQNGFYLDETPQTWSTPGAGFLDLVAKSARLSGDRITENAAQIGDRIGQDAAHVNNHIDQDARAAHEAEQPAITTHGPGVIQGQLVRDGVYTPHLSIGDGSQFSERTDNGVLEEDMPDQRDSPWSESSNPDREAYQEKVAPRRPDRVGPDYEAREQAQIEYETNPTESYTYVDGDYSSPVGMGYALRESLTELMGPEIFMADHLETALQEWQDGDTPVIWLGVGDGFAVTANRIAAYFIDAVADERLVVVSTNLVSPIYAGNKGARYAAECVARLKELNGDAVKHIRAPFSNLVS